VHGLTKILFKSFIETVRCRTFGKNGFQQIQVDVEFIRMNFWRLITDEKASNQLLDEVLKGASLRCLERVPMEPSVIEKILAASDKTGGD
jgi:hypothetical protein